MSEVEVPKPLQLVASSTRSRVGAPVNEESFSAYLRRVAGSPDLLSLARRVAGWISRAELWDLLRWNLPERVDFDPYPEVEVDSKVCESSWLADRFLLTYLADWNTASLHDEFRWSRGLKEGPLAVELMDLRRAPRERLHEEIAQRAVEGDGRDQRSLLNAGVELLIGGQHEQATALFQGALAISNSQWVRNCLAFSLVPSDPAGAALMFTELLEEGFDPLLLHANLAATSHILGDTGSAFAHAQEGLSSVSETDSRVAFLWGFEEGQLSLISNARIVDYLRSVLSWGRS